MSFEENLKELEACAQKLKDGNTSLDEALKAYETGMKKYDECAKILEETKQKIESYNRKDEI